MTILAISSGDRFVCSAYLADEHGTLRAERPESCPSARKAGTCAVVRFGRRARTNGPEYYLEIFHCTNHNVHFTAYPPGWMPYKRAPLVLLDPAGKPIVQTEADSDESTWSSTVFQGVIDAGMGALWPEEKQLGVGSPISDAPGVTRTQKRCIRSFMHLFGLLVQNHRKRRERVSNLFNLPITTLENSRKKMNGTARAPPLWKIRGKLGKAILESIDASPQTYGKMLQMM